MPVALWGRRSEAISLTGLGDMKLPFAADQLAPYAHAAAAVSPENAGLELFVTRQLVSSYSAAEQFQQQIRSGTKSEAANYPSTKLAANLELISQLIKSGSQARVFYTQQSGYDTHAAQLYTHAQLLSEFSSALKAFLDDLKGAELEDRVITLAFSEFGRRVKENSSQGTDHGAAGPVFVAGRKIDRRTGGRDSQPFRSRRRRPQDERRHARNLRRSARGLAWRERCKRPRRQFARAKLFQT